MQKIVVGGSIGAGKTIFAKALSKKLNIEHVELDSLYWLPGWQSRTIGQWGDLAIKATNIPKWVVCGNYFALKNIILDQADVIIWLDYPFFICFWQTLKRSLKRLIMHEAYCNGNQESLGRLFFSKESILVLMVETFRRRNKRYTAMMRDSLYKDKIFVRLKSHKQAKNWLENFRLS